MSLDFLATIFEAISLSDFFQQSCKIYCMKTKGPVVNTTGIKSGANIIPNTWLFHNIQIHTYKEHRKKDERKH